MSLQKRWQLRHPRPSTAAAYSRTIAGTSEVSMEPRARTQGGLSLLRRTCQGQSRQSRSLMCQTIEHVVDAQLVRLVRLVEREESLSRPLPILRDVVVVVRNDHQSLRWIVVLKHSVVARTNAGHRMHNLVDVLDLKERIEDAMRVVEPDEPTVGKHAAHLCLEVIPLPCAVKVLEYREAAFQQVGAK